MIVLRVHRQDRPTLIRVFKQAIELPPTETLAGRLWMLEETRFRSRGE